LGRTFGLFVPFLNWTNHFALLIPQTLSTSYAQRTNPAFLTQWRDEAGSRDVLRGYLKAPTKPPPDKEPTPDRAVDTRLKYIPYPQKSVKKGASL